MTIHLSSLGQVYLVCGKTDMRQGIDSLAYLIKTHFESDPFSRLRYYYTSLLGGYEAGEKLPPK
ncbi:IS66 family insertion sequence element accessory protein TnpB [Streptococcus pseudopneumoniae]|uniref:IS66 family insertion sequence element accessory protein TnpB n=1 Tax=Streptococcus pseudopneumoniae TaxID=257758 RepID=UPI00021B034C|nr:IS66 family insertion sequence element accessory protein TnpB [Streptococcus pseudopneumoniae]AEL10112.1 IS66 family element, Orf2 [Streptococcus pseudopneumoniae IS7493]